MALIDNILRYLKCEDNAANTTVTDATGTGNGTASTNTSNLSATGKIDLGFDMNGSSENVNLGNVFDIDGTSISIGVWIKTDDTTTQQKIIASNIGTEPSINLKIQDDDFQFSYGDPVDDLLYSCATTDNSLTTGWHYIVAVFTAGTGLELYVDGSSVCSDTTGSANVKSPTSGLDVYFGSDNRGIHWFNGTLDELGIWDKALTSSEVTSLYNGGSGFQYPFTAADVDNAIFHSMNF